MTDTPNYRSEFIEHEDYLEVVNFGTVIGAQEMIAYSGVSVAKAIELGYKKVFVDESQIVIKLEDNDQLELMNFFLNSFPKSLDMKFSVLYSLTQKDGALFFDGLSKKVGFDCTFFSTKDEALGHLLG